MLCRLVGRIAGALIAAPRAYSQNTAPDEPDFPLVDHQVRLSRGFSLRDAVRLSKQARPEVRHCPNTPAPNENSNLAF